MLFKKEHIEMIKKGKKTVTRRIWKRNMVKRGNVYMANTEMFVKREDCTCFIKVTDVFHQPLWHMRDIDAEHEGYDNMREFREVWEEINGEGSWDPKQTVTVVEFEYAGDCMEAIDNDE